MTIKKRLLASAVVLAMMTGCVTLPDAGIVTNKVFYPQWDEDVMVNDGERWQCQHVLHPARYYVFIVADGEDNALTVNSNQYVRATVGQPWALN